MITIRTGCPSCGEVDIRPELVVLSFGVGRRGEYRFDCPGCCTAVVKPADSRLAALLISAGVRVVQAGGSPVPEAPPFTFDDLVAFHEELQDEAALERFLAGR